MRTCYGCQTPISESIMQCPTCLRQLRCRVCNEVIGSADQQAAHASCVKQSPEPKPAANSAARSNQPTLGQVARDLGVIIAQPFARWRVSQAAAAIRNLKHWPFVGVSLVILLSLVFIIGRCANPARAFYGTWEIVNAESGAESTLRIIIQPDHTATMTSLMVYRGAELANESTSGVWWVDPQYPKSILMNETKGDMDGVAQLTLPDRDRLRLAPTDPDASTDDFSALIYRRVPKN